MSHPKPAQSSNGEAHPYFRRRAINHCILCDLSSEFAMCIEHRAECLDETRPAKTRENPRPTCSPCRATTCYYADYHYFDARDDVLVGSDDNVAKFSNPRILNRCTAMTGATPMVYDGSIFQVSDGAINNWEKSTPNFPVRGNPGVSGLPPNIRAPASL